MGILQLVNKPYSTIKTDVLESDEKTGWYKGRPVWVLKDRGQPVTSWEHHSVCVSQRSATTIAFACRLSDLLPIDGFTIVFHDLGDFKRSFSITHRSCTCVLRDLRPGTTYNLYYDVYACDAEMKKNIPLSTASTMTRFLEVELTSATVVTNGSVMRYNVITNDPDFHEREVGLELQQTQQRVMRTTLLREKRGLFTCALESHPLESLRHKDFSFPVLTLQGERISPSQNVLALTHVEECHVHCETTLHTVQVQCKTVYSQAVRCTIELVRNDVILETVVTQSTFNHTFDKLTSDTIYDVRIQVCDTMNQTSFAYVSEATKKYFVNSFVVTQSSRGLVSFGSVFEQARFVTNMEDLTCLDIELRTDDDTVLVSWNDVEFERTGLFVRAKGRFELTVDNIRIEKSTTASIYASLTGNGETLRFQTPVTCDFEFDLSEPDGEPDLRTITAHQSNASIQLVGYEDFKTGFPFEYSFHLECVGPDNQSFGSKHVDLKQCVEFNALLPDTPYKTACHVTSVATGARTTFETHRFRTLVDADYVTVHVACEFDSPWEIVFETTHGQRLAFVVKRDDRCYRVRRNSTIKLNGPTDTHFLSTSNASHYDLRVGPNSRITYLGFDWTTSFTRATQFTRTFECM